MADDRYTDQLRKLKMRFGFDFVSLAIALEAGQPLLTWIHATGNKNTRYRRICIFYKCQYICAFRNRSGYKYI